MPTAIWIIMHGLQPAREAEYLEWFHDVHIPDKLAREGYIWASHYQVLSDGDSGYIAMFGGRDASVFYNPSPAQLDTAKNPMSARFWGGFGQAEWFGRCRRGHLLDFADLPECPGWFFRHAGAVRPSSQTSRFML